jgi:hypothetical protein
MVVIVYSETLGILPESRPVYPKTAFNLYGCFVSVQIGRGWRAKRAAFDVARAASLLKKAARPEKPVRADRLGLTDEKTIREPKTIFMKTVLLIFNSP